MERYGVISPELSEQFAGYKVYLFSNDSERYFSTLSLSKDKAEEIVSDWEELEKVPDSAEVGEG